MALYALEAVTVGALVGGQADAAVLAIASIELTFGPATVAYVAFVRRRRMAVVALAPILFLSFVVATVVIPKGHHQTLDAIGLLFARIELAVVSLGIWKILGPSQGSRPRWTPASMGTRRSALSWLRRSPHAGCTGGPGRSH